MSQNSFQQLKQSYSKQRRRQELQKRFAQKRKQLSIQLAEKQKTTFESILPIINHQNYEQNRYLMSDFARSSEYSYQMLPITFVVYEYLLSNPADAPSWQIIAYLSYYEDFQIPQTEELAHMILDFLGRNTQLASEFLLNISSNQFLKKELSKCSLLCCRLIDMNIIEIIGEIVQKTQEFYWRESLERTQFRGKEELEIQIFNFLTALSYFFTLKPMLQFSELKTICEILNLQTKSNRFLIEIHTEVIFRLLQNIIQGNFPLKKDFTKQRDILQFLISQFQSTLCNSFFVYQQQSITFLNLCVKNKIALTEKLVHNLFICIKSKNNKSKVAALQLLQHILMPEQKIQKMQVQSLKYNNLGSFIQSNSLPSLQEFGMMFTFKNQQSSQKLHYSEQRNTLLVYFLLFTQNYQKQLRVLFQIYQNSGQKIQQQIVILIKHIIKCLIQEIHNYHPKRLIETKKQPFIPENMEEFLHLTVQQQELYLFLSECLKSSNVAIISNALEILQNLAIYFRNQDNQFDETIDKVDFKFLLNQCHKFGIYSSLEYLFAQDNSQVRDQIEDLMNLLDQDTD